MGDFSTDKEKFQEIQDRLQAIKNAEELMDKASQKTPQTPSTTKVSKNPNQQPEKKTPSPQNQGTPQTDQPSSSPETDSEPKP